jgi:hypothetical protein
MKEEFRRFLVEAAKRMGAEYVSKIDRITEGVSAFSEATDEILYPRK